MTDVAIYGFPQSSYVRTARLACEEKGVAYDLVPVEFGSPEHLELHPFGKIPAFRHGELVLSETSAIARYVDAAFPGPRLVPAGAEAQGRMEQWVSTACDYLYQDMIRGLVFPRLVAPSRGAEPDEEMIAQAMPKVEHHLGVLDQALIGRDYLAGSALSLADLFVAPIAFWVRLTPEGQARKDGYPNLNRWWERMAARPSMAATEPAMPGQKAA